MVRAYGGTRPIPSFAAATLHTCHYCKTSTTSVNMTDSGSARESVGTLRDIGRPRRRYCSPPALGMQPRGRRPGSRRLPALARRCTHSDRGNNAQNHRTRGRRTYSYTDNDTRTAESHGFERPTVIRNLDTRENVHNELYRTNPWCPTEPITTWLPARRYYKARKEGFWPIARDRSRHSTTPQT